MASNSGDLTQTLIGGGLTPQAARAIANALANAHTGTFSRGRDISDTTPTDQLRLVTAETRRYQLTNLDFSPTAPFQDRLASNPGQYAGLPQDHPYKDSQPISSDPPLSAPRVQGSDYVDVTNDVEGNSAVSKVALRLRQQTGRHLRIDPSTKFLDALPFNASSESPRFVSAEFSESDAGSDLKVSLRNLEQMTVLLSNATQRSVWAFPDSAATSLAAESLSSLADAILRQGTWSPALFSWQAVAGGAGTNPTMTYNAVTAGRWFRLGQWVYVTGRLSIATITAAGSGYFGVTNLPFLVAPSEVYAGWVAYKAGFVGAGPDLCYAQDTTVFSSSGRNNSLVLGFHTATGTGLNTNGNFAVGSDFAFGCIYRTTAALNASASEPFDPGSIQPGPGG